jgi:hypothetical protein
LVARDRFEFFIPIQDLLFRHIFLRLTLHPFPSPLSRSYSRRGGRGQRRGG